MNYNLKDLINYVIYKKKVLMKELIIMDKVKHIKNIK